MKCLTNTGNYLLSVYSTGNFRSNLIPSSRSELSGLSVMERSTEFLHLTSQYLTFLTGSFSRTVVAVNRNLPFGKVNRPWRDSSSRLSRSRPYPFEDHRQRCNILHTFCRLGHQSCLLKRYSNLLTYTYQSTSRTQAHLTKI